MNTSIGATATVWLVLTLLLAGMAILVVWSRARTRVRPLAVFILVVGSPLSAAAMMVCLGWPVPYVPGLTVTPGESNVLGAKMLVDQGIFVLVDRGESPPRYVWMPWDPKVADSLQAAQDEAGQEGDVILKTPPFEWSWSRKNDMFYALPQPKVLPDKLRETVPELDSDSI